MESSILLKTKVSKPMIRNYTIDRPEWIHRVEQGMNFRINMIYAPAGSGKTTLLGQWLYEKKQPYAWLSLDERDNDPRRFWRYMIYSLSCYMIPDLEERLLPLLSNSSMSSITSFIDMFIHELDQLKAPLAMILDDYQFIASSDIHKGLCYLIDYLPPHIHLYISSRQTLPFVHIGKWLVRQQLNIIAAGEMAFSEEEVALLCQHTIGYSLPAEIIHKLVQQTEGWIAGIQLALISFQQDEGQYRFTLDFNGKHRSIADYLFYEVWSGFDEELQSFLLQTSILKRMNAELCDELTGLQDSQCKLHRLQQLTLFLIPLDEDGEWYRYHHLFAEFVQNVLRQSSHTRWISGHQKASQIYIERQWIEEAIDHSLIAHNYEQAAQLIDNHVEEWLSKGELDTLLHWFQLFPADYEFTIALCLIQAFILGIVDRFEESIELLKRCEQRIKALSSSDKYSNYLGILFLVKTNILFASRDFDEWFAFMRSIQQQIPQNSVFFHFNYNKNEPFVRNTAFGLKGLLSQETAHVSAEMIRILHQQHGENSLLVQYVMQAVVEGSYERNDLNTCIYWVQKISKNDNYRIVPGLLVPFRLMTVKLKLKEKQYITARTILENTLQLLEDPQYHNWRKHLYAFIAWIDLLEGHIEKSIHVLDSISITSKQRISLDQSLAFMILSRALIANKDYNTALEILASIRFFAENEHSTNIECSVIVLQSICTYRKGQVDTAILLLQQAIELVMPFDYVRTFVDEGMVIYILLQKLSHKKHIVNHPQMLKYITKLLNILEAEGKIPLSLTDNHLIEALTPKELDVLKLIRQGHSNQQIADQLGLTIGTIKVYINRIYNKLGVTSRVQALLKSQELELLSGL
ncbi:LuxR C-terminal-related transcriptional regulator [Paenibacillus kyungheensis]